MSDSIQTNPEVSVERHRIQSLLTELNSRPIHQFPERLSEIPAPHTQGVYVIRSETGQVLHVGRTVSGRKGIAQRLGNHFRGKSSFVRSYLNGKTQILRSSYTFQFIEVDNNRVRALLEYCAIAWFCPAHLGLGVIDEK